MANEIIYRPESDPARTPVKPIARPKAEKDSLGWFDLQEPTSFSSYLVRATDRVGSRLKFKMLDCRAAPNETAKDISDNTFEIDLDDKHVLAKLPTTDFRDFKPGDAADCGFLFISNELRTKLGPKFSKDEEVSINGQGKSPRGGHASEDFRSAIRKVMEMAGPAGRARLSVKERDLVDEFLTQDPSRTGGAP